MTAMTAHNRFSAELGQLLTAKPVLVMGVLNLTPDSFSDGGTYLNSDTALARITELFASGADLVDIGAESTAPGATPVPLETEWERLWPTLSGTNSHASPSLRILSIDTFKSQIAERALSLGAALINDVSALRADPEMAQTIAAHDAHVLLMHSKESGEHPHVTDSPRDYTDVVREVCEFLLTQARVATSAGIREDKILLDPGMGRFVSHDPKYSWELLRRFEDVCRALAPFPVCIATSRKGFLGGNLSDRDAVSQLTALRAVNHGARMVRTHAPDMMRAFLDIEARTSVSCRAI